MTRKHIVVTGLTISVILLMIAISIYPGGTYSDKNSVGFAWTKNFISDLFKPQSLNGAPNLSRIWAFAGMLIYSITCAVFFVNMSKKIPEKTASDIIKYAGILTMPCTLLIITPLHDLMLTISSFLFWTGIICITVFVLKARFYVLKFYCVICLLIFYYAVFLHATNNWELLPVIQKVNNISAILLIFALEWFTKKEDFAHIKTGKNKVTAAISQHPATAANPLPQNNIGSN